ncbi:MAG: nucleoside deaminase [Bacteroidia bacterium]
MYSDEYFMGMALKEAEKAYNENEVPVGCIIVCNNKIIGKGYNLTEKLNDVTAHAEMQAITAAANYLGSKYLTDCTMYVTLEPCVMCAGAIYWSQLSKLIIGASDEKRGFLRLNQNILHPKTNIQTGILAEQCSNIIKNFFKELR